MHTKSRRLIVYIEDTQELIELLRLILNDGRLTIEAAVTGQQGLKLVRRLKPDLVLLDLMLPDLGGWEIFEQMQRDPSLREIPVIVISVRAKPLTDEVGYEQMQRLAGYLVKPFSIPELRQSVQQALDITTF